MDGWMDGWMDASHKKANKEYVADESMASKCVCRAIEGQLYQVNRDRLHHQESSIKHRDRNKICVRQSLSVQPTYTADTACLSFSLRLIIITIIVIITCCPFAIQYEKEESKKP